MNRTLVSIGGVEAAWKHVISGSRHRLETNFNLILHLRGKTSQYVGQIVCVHPSAPRTNHEQLTIFVFLHAISRPLTVHCSPGTGRTGTIIACDIAIRTLEQPTRSVDIPQIVYCVRRGRASAVQTREQYEFIYKVSQWRWRSNRSIEHMTVNFDLVRR